MIREQKHQHFDFNKILATRKKVVHFDKVRKDGKMVRALIPSALMLGDFRFKLLKGNLFSEFPQAVLVITQSGNVYIGDAYI